MAAKPKIQATTIDAYLAELEPPMRKALERLRRTIRSAAPKAEECFSYGLPAFRQDGPLVAFGASSGHVSFFPMNGTSVAAHAKELAGFDTSKGTIRFTPAKPLPAALVKTLVKERLAENAAKAGARRTKSK